MSHLLLTIPYFSCFVPLPLSFFWPKYRPQYHPGTWIYYNLPYDFYFPGVFQHTPGSRKAAGCEEVNMGKIMKQEKQSQASVLDNMGKPQNQIQRWWNHWKRLILMLSLLESLPQPVMLINTEAAHPLVVRSPHAQPHEVVLQDGYRPCTHT